MSDMSNRPMMSATDALRTRKTRIGSIGPIALWRTVELLTLVTGLIGGAIGMIIAVLVGGGIDGIVWGLAIGAGGAIALVKYQPIRHHSLYRFIRLWMASRKGRSIIQDGKAVRMHIGVAAIDEGPRGPLTLSPGAIDVAEGQYDERGVLIKGE